MSTIREVLARYWLSMVATIVLVGVTVGIVADVGWNYWQARERFHAKLQREACEGNLEHVGQAIRHFADANDGRFPPAYFADKDGRPMHSWRVRMLPGLEEEELHARYDFKQPWDSRGNLVLADKVVQRYVCPTTPREDLSCTNYVMIVGPGMVSDGPNSVARSDVIDGTSNTIIVAEVGSSGIKWLEPRDLNAEEISYTINDSTGKGIGGHHPGGAHLLFCDGSVRFLKDSTDAGIVRALTTVAGSEDVSESMEAR